MERNHQMIAQRAETLRLSGAYEQAVEIFEQIQQNYPDNAWINAHLGATYYELMDYGKAEKHLKDAIAKNQHYLWAYAQLGETYRLRAITEYRQDQKNQYIQWAIESFQKALDADKPEDSNYAWALAHLGATYRLCIPQGIRDNKCQRAVSAADNGKRTLTHHIEDALKCLNRAIELIPTYAWAWGMRATVYRLDQKYTASFWDLGVLTVIAPEIEILQHSSSPVSFLESRWVNLHEHAFLSFYLTKNEADIQEKKRQYGRAIAYAQQALQVRPGDLLAKLILLVVTATQKKEEMKGSLSIDEFQKIKTQLEKFMQEGELRLAEICQKVLRYLASVEEEVKVCLESFRDKEKEHKLTQVILKDVIADYSFGVGPEPQLWLWKNFGWTQTCSSVLWLLSDLSYILNEDCILGTARPYRQLALLINHDYTLERLYQTPVFCEPERSDIFDKLMADMAA